jgi:hypothetical protein
MSIYAQNFNDLNDGDLNGQDSWSGYAMFDVQTSVKYEGAKAVAFLGQAPDGWDKIQRTITTTTDNFSASIAMKLKKGSSGDTVGILALFTGTTKFVEAYCLAGATDTLYLNNSSVITGMTSEAWHLFNVEVDFTQSKARVQVDGGTFSSWINFLSASSQCTSIKIEHLSEHSTAYGYYDALDIYLPPVVPTVTTQAASSVLSTSFTGNGNITDTGGANATRRGFCYLQGNSGDPTITDSVAYDDGDFGTGAYTKSVTGLTAETAYRNRAYATNSAGTSYGSTVDVTTGAESTGSGNFFNFL